jgi:Type II secretion system (T2SS), protein E, N-terminal domain
LTPFEIRLTADHGGDVHTGQTLGHLAASHGLFLYEQSPGGNVQACWYSTAALEQVRVGAYQWHSRHKAAQPAPVAVPVPVHGQPAHTVSELAAAWAELHHRPAPHARDIMTELGCWPEDRVWQGVDMTSGDWLSELVQKGALTTEQSQHVLSRMAGLPEVDLPSFKVESDAMQLLASHARRYLVYPLGSTGDVFLQPVPTRPIRPCRP